jgi:hypothetical protein
MTTGSSMIKKTRSEIGKASAKKGKLDKNKIKERYKKAGWMVETIEKYQMIFSPKGRFIVKRDLWGADLLAVKGEECKMIQCKQNNEVEFKKAKAEFKKYPVPSFIQQVVAYWDSEKHRAIEIDINNF